VKATRPTRTPARAHEPEPGESSDIPNDGSPTMGELLANQKELANEHLGSHTSEQNDWNDDHLEREERDRREEHLGREEHRKDRVRTKDGAQGSNQESAKQARQPGLGRTQGGPHGPASGRAGAGGPRGSDGFESAVPTPMRTSAAAKPALSLSGESLAAPPPPSRMTGGAMHVLNTAKEPGVYFREQGRQGGQGEEDEDPELAEAVEEAIRLLFGVRGIHHIGPGLNQAGEPVVLISVSRGFSESSMRAVPDRVNRFPTLVALPFELLPLRRDAY
jgi:hypothetical protein